APSPDGEMGTRGMLVASAARLAGRTGDGAGEAARSARNSESDSPTSDARPLIVITNSLFTAVMCGEFCSWPEPLPENVLSGPLVAPVLLKDCACTLSVPATVSSATAARE